MDVGSLAPIRKMDIGILRQALNTDNITTDENLAQSEETQLLPEIFRLLASLEDDTQKLLLDSWAKLEMPLNEENVANLLSYLEDNPASTEADKMAVIKAFAFLEKTGLPFSEKIIDGLRSLFNNDSLNSNLENILYSNNSMSEEQLNNLTANLNLNQLKESLKTIDNYQQENQTDFNQDPQASSNQEVTASSNQSLENTALENQASLNPDFLNSLSNLDSESKNLILNNLNSLSQNFDDNTLKILNNYLANHDLNTAVEKTALLKAFSFLENNQLPLTENLISESSSLFLEENTEGFINNIDNKNEIFSALTAENNSLISENETALNLDTNVEQIAQSLANHSKISDQILSLFNKIGGENEEKTANNILGQKLINLQQLEQNTALMLGLEIPVQVKENKLSSLLLKIEKDSAKQTSNENKNSGYNISFIMEFEKIGPIQSNININKKEINTTFFTESAQTAQLIENNFSELKNNLEAEGFNINSVRIKNLKDFENEKNQFFNNLILAELNEKNSGEGKYTHIDIKI